MRAAASWVVVAMGVALAPRPAAAQPSSSAPPDLPAQSGPPGLMPGQPAADSRADKPAETRWYGWEIFLADAGVAAMALGAQRTEPLIALSLTGMVVHAGHGRYGASSGSVLLRLASPALGGFLGSLTCDEDPSGESLNCLDNIAIGIFAGGALALGIDYFLLGRETIARPRPAIAPSVLLKPGASTAGVQLAF
jgi:hypothetical protein